MTSTDRNEHGVGHFLLVIILELVLSHENFVLLLSIGNLNGLAVALTHRELLGAIGGLVDIDLALHASRTHQRIVNGTELL